MIGLRVLDPDGAEIPVFGGSLTLEEHRDYQVLLPATREPPRAHLDARTLAWDPHSGAFPLNLAMAAGEQRLRIQMDTRTLELRVRVRPDREKLSEDAWLALLQDLDAWLPGLSVGLEGTRHGAVRVDGASAAFLSEALIPLLPLLERSFRALLEQPRERSFTRVNEVPVRATRRVDRESLAWLGRHPEVSRWLDPWRAAELPGPEPLLPQRQVRHDFDHPVNRYMAWLLLRVERALRATATGLGGLAAKAAAGSLTDSAAWCEARADALTAGAERLCLLHRRSTLSQLRPAPPSEAALLVLADDPVYARAHRVGRLFLSPRFRLRADGDAPQAAIRPTFHLYELWTFLAVQRLLAAHLPGWTWTVACQEQLLDLQGSGAGARWTGQGSDGTLELHFNLTFPGWFARRGSTRWSVSTERRPDLALTWAGVDGARSWLCLDAKYRAGRRNLGDALTSVHLYRDALRWSAFGGPCRAALLLAPATTPDVADWCEPAFWGEHGLGIERLEPGRVGESCLARWCLDTLRGRVWLGDRELNERRQ